MDTLRFGFLTVALFALAFIGISWVAKGFPVTTMRVESPRLEARIPTFEQGVKAGLRKDWENSRTAQGDGDPKREALRLALLQAANAYALSPCDKTMKKNLVEALSAYAKAWTELAGCKSGVCSHDKRIDTATAAFSTPSDMRVRAALSEAFEKGGVSRDDFPASIRLWVTMLAGDPGNPASACANSRTANGLH